MIKTVRAYRVFYTTFHEEEHQKVKELLRSIVGVEPIEHISFIKEFRYLEFKNDALNPGLEAKIYETVASVLGKDKGIKVDYINV